MALNEGAGDKLGRVLPLSLLETVKLSFEAVPSELLEVRAFFFSFSDWMRLIAVRALGAAMMSSLSFENERDRLSNC